MIRPNTIPIAPLQISPGNVLNPQLNIPFLQTPLVQQKQKPPKQPIQQKKKPK